MNKERKPLFNGYRITVIIILILILILLIFPLVYNTLSGKSNKYTQGLNELASIANECINDNDCTNNGYCYIKKCICKNGWTGEDCQIPCEGSFTANCTSNINCTFDGNIVGDCHFGWCVCYPGYVGDNCEFERRDVSFCDEDLDCNTGRCIFVPPSFVFGECYCPENTINWNCIFP